MLNWLFNRRKRRWTRRTRWTPLLLSQREFQRVLEKERIRTDRTGTEFGFIILRFTDFIDLRNSSIRLAKLLHRRLRETDEKGHLGVGRIGVALPCTNSQGTELVLSHILQLAYQAGLSIEGESFVYPDNDRRSKKHDASDTDANGIGEVEEFLPTRSIPMALVARPFPKWKRAIDVVGASIGLVIASPVIAASALLIRCTSPGPALFTQRRTGYMGETFTIYKLRTMVANAEELKADLAHDNERDGPAFKIRRDPRVTTIGRILRATGLDELPQLVNVLKGDMSLVGPRPLPVAEDAQCLPWQRRRLDTKPGLTCFWQLAKSREIPFVEWMRLDMKYSRKRSLWLDMGLILRTFAAVFLGRVGH